MVIYIANSQVKLEHIKDLQIDNVDLTKISDGVYTGKYNVFPISVIVKVKIDNHKISDITLVKHFNGQGASAEAILDHIIKNQTLNVDIIAGATYSSKIILKSIENALNSAVK
jgi:uncharacterized protein with FMN-binding domain